VLFAQLLFGYAMLQALMLIRLLPWIAVGQPFTPSYWSFTFGVATLAGAALCSLKLGNRVVSDLDFMICKEAKAALEAADWWLGRGGKTDTGRPFIPSRDRAKPPGIQAGRHRADACPSATG